LVPNEPDVLSGCAPVAVLVVGGGGGGGETGAVGVTGVALGPPTVCKGLMMDIAIFPHIFDVIGRGNILLPGGFSPDEL